MSRIQPYKGISSQRLDALIRASQIKSLTQSVTLKFGAVQKSLAAKNTKVMVTASDLGGSYPAVEVKYVRLNLDVLHILPFGELLPFDNIVFPTTTHAILNTINKAIGLNLAPNEVLDKPITMLPTNSVSLTMLAGSYAWLPGEHEFIYAPDAPERAARAQDLRIPRDERRRIRVLEDSGT